MHPIVFLRRVGAELTPRRDVRRPFAIISGNAGSTSAQARIRPLFEGEVASIDGTIRLSVPAFLPPESFSIEVEGIGKLVEFEVAQATREVHDAGAGRDGGPARPHRGGFGALAEIRTSWFDGETSQFDVEAFARLRVPGLGLGQASTSSPRLLEPRLTPSAPATGERFGFGGCGR